MGETRNSANGRREPTSDGFGHPASSESGTRTASGLLEGLQSWRGLLFLHWPVPYEPLRRVVPAELPLDLKDGTAWVSIVALDMVARPPLVPEGLSLRFLETNARTYVRLPGGEPGVFFFSLDATSRLAAAGARLAYGLPYHHARSAREREGGFEVHRSARRGVAAHGVEVRYRLGDPVGTAVPGSLDHFLVERYALGVVRRGTLSTVRVVHPPYPLRAVEVDSVVEDLLAPAGVERPDEPPALAHWSDGLDVEVRRVVDWSRRARQARARKDNPEASARYLSRV